MIGATIEFAADILSFTRMNEHWRQDKDLPQQSKRVGNRTEPNQDNCNASMNLPQLKGLQVSRCAAFLVVSSSMNSLGCDQFDASPY